MRPENWKLREPMRGAIAPGAPKDGLATAVQRGRPFPMNPLLALSCTGRCLCCSAESLDG